MVSSFKQRWIVGLLALGSALAPNAFSQSTRSATEPAVRIISTNGMVEVRRADATNWSRAETNQTLVANDQIKTGTRSRVLLRWSEDSQLRVGDRTTVRILPPSK